MATYELGARVRAARALIGIESATKLAQALDVPKLSRTKMYAIERGELPPARHELEAIAELCELPIGWFVADFDRLDELVDEDPKKAIARAIAEADERVSKRRGK